jgi:hypothetical protein
LESAIAAEVRNRVSSVNLDAARSLRQKPGFLRPLESAIRPEARNRVSSENLDDSRSLWLETRFLEADGERDRSL